MKPDWKDAPEWAQWLGYDLVGGWRWYEKGPVWIKWLGWSSEGGGREEWAADPETGDLEPRDLEPRP